MYNTHGPSERRQVVSTVSFVNVMNVTGETVTGTPNPVCKASLLKEYPREFLVPDDSQKLVTKKKKKFNIYKNTNNGYLINEYFVQDSYQAAQ